jgi:hypothetical protein
MALSVTSTLPTLKVWYKDFISMTKGELSSIRRRNGVCGAWIACFASCANVVPEGMM